MASSVWRAARQIYVRRFLSSTTTTNSTIPTITTTAVAPSSSGSASVRHMSDEEKLRLLRAGMSPACGRPLSEIAADIWHHNTAPAGAGQRSGLKVLRRPLKGELYRSWYPPTLREVPGNPYILTDKQERWKKKLKMLRAAGKGPPKKGAGKRSK